jgi:hypothetical protein
MATDRRSRSTQTLRMQGAQLPSKGGESGRSTTAQLLVRLPMAEKRFVEEAVKKRSIDVERSFPGATFNTNAFARSALLKFAEEILGHPFEVSAKTAR